MDTVVRTLTQVAIALGGVATALRIKLPCGMVSVGQRRGIETMHVRFTVRMDAPTGGSGTRSAAIAADALVAAIRPTYTR